MAAALLLAGSLPVVAANAQALTPDDPNYWWTPEFVEQWGLWQTDAVYAYTMGYDGKGVIVGVADSAVDASHPELQGQVVGGYDFGRNSSQLQFENSHGTQVASIIAARRDGIGFHGVAPGAKILSASISNAEGWVGSSQTVANAWDYLLDGGARIINNSWGVFDTKVVDQTAVAVAADDPIFLAAARDAVARNALVVFITHNGGMDDANVQSGLPYLFPELERGWLAVTGGPEYAGIANQCGVAMRWCLAAPSDSVMTAIPGGGYAAASGTSMGAPFVSGTAALVWQAFPWMNADQVRQVLLGTAIDIGAPGVDPVYGYGMVNAAWAVRGPGKFDWGDFKADFDNWQSQWHGDITGAGGLIKSGNGVLILNGQSTYSGTTRINGGTLAIAPSGGIESDTYVDLGGRLSGSGYLVGNVENRGEFQPGYGADGGTMSIFGDFSQFAGATTLFTLNAPDGTSRFTADNANLAGTAYARITPGMFRGTDTQEVAAVTGVISGTFDRLTNPHAFLDMSLAYGPQAVSLTVARNGAAFASMAGSANGAGAADAIEAMGLGTPLYDAVVTAYTPNAARTFEQLSGNEQASMGTVLAQSAGMVGTTANSRLRTAFGSAGATEVPLMSYAPTANPIMIEMDYATGPAFWSSSQAAWGSGGPMDQFGLGQFMGVDAPLGAWRLGALTGFGSTSARSANSRLDASDYHFGLYGGTQWGDLALRTGAAYSVHSLSAMRSVTAAGLDQTLTSRYGGKSAQAFAELGYGIETAGLRFEPFAGLATMNVWTDGFSETGGSAALTGSGTSLSTLFSSIGLTVEAPLVLGGTFATARGSVAWRHAFGDSAPTSTQAFAGSTAFTVTGASVERDTALLEAGVDFQLSPSATLGVAYGGQLSSQNQRHGVSADLRVEF